MNNSKKKYTKVDLNVHEYGRGRNKDFILYTDWNPDTQRYMRRVYPDICGNKSNAIKQGLRWLNSEHPDNYNISTGESKIFISYRSPFNFVCETNIDGTPF